MRVSAFFEPAPSALFATGAEDGDEFHVLAHLAARIHDSFLAPPGIDPHEQISALRC